jgi:hypothetical protein
MDSGTFAGWAWAIIGVVIGVALMVLILVTVVREILHPTIGKAKPPAMIPRTPQSKATVQPPKGRRQ